MRRKGNLVRMTADALENYGQEWAGVVLVIDSVSTKYMPSKEFFARGKPKGYHPGYDPASRSALYDLHRDDTEEELTFSLYDWEVQRVR